VVIAVVVVATALCADRPAAAAAQPRVPGKSLATRIASSFRQVVPPARVQLQPARTGERTSSFAPPIREASSGVRGSDFSPVQFRLPPPTR